MILACSALAAGEPLPQHLVHSLELYADHLAARRAHRTGEVDCPLTVIHADAHRSDDIRRDQAEWAGRSRATVTYHVLGGDHHSILRTADLATAIISSWENSSG